MADEDNHTSAVPARSWGLLGRIWSSDAARIRPWLGYLVAIVTCGVALLLRRLLDGVFPPGFPYVTFFPAVIVTAYVAGLRPAMFCTLLCTLAAWYFFIPPVNSFAVDLPTALALAFFVSVAGFIVAIIDHMQVVTAKLTIEREKSDRLYQQQKVVFQELQHRVANNMQFVASLLHLQRREIETDPATALSALNEASRRIETMAGVHRRLYDPSSIDVPVGQYLEEICRDVVTASGATHVTLQVEAVPVRFDVERLMLLSLVTAEAVTNCLKHAFLGRDAGRILVRLAQVDDAELALSISDDGCGLPVDRGTVRLGLGTRILQGLAGQLRGTLSITADGGTITRLTFPAT